MAREPLPVLQLVANIVHRDDAAAAAELLPLLYDQLKRVAADLLRNERKHHTLQPTALVHEAYLRLAQTRLDDGSLDWRGKARLAALAARAMRNVLCDHARTRGAQKRGGGWRRITLHGLVGEDPVQQVDLLTLDEALTQLAEQHPRPARVVELRFFANMTRLEIVEVLGVSERTVGTDLAFAQAWLLRAMDAPRDRDAP